MTIDKLIEELEDARDELGGGAEVIVSFRRHKKLDIMYTLRHDLRICQSQLEICTEQPLGY